ncbi:hypothetical protein, partial [Thauera aromatica]|uniref:hypothetical protein n=1 Tax=Thauera aromatica TaxID=59405 RepID=UPI001FFD2EFF
SNFLKNRCNSLQQRGEIMINFHFAVKHFVRLFSTAPAHRQNKRLLDTRLTPPLPPYPASVETAAAPKSCAL